MKYEAVFGDQSLFFDAHRDCEMVGNGHHKVENGKLMVWNFSEKYWTESYTNEITIAAMRRIITEPKRWTWEDKKAGRLPEVGAIVVSDGFNEKCEFLGVGMVNGFFVVRLPNGLININSASSFKPIETPEEKSARLREEWCIKALSSCSILSGMQKYELKRLGGYIEDIYDALLSGDLPVPGKE